MNTTGTAKKYEYDGTGNLRFEKQPNGTVIREYRWDQQNRLVRELHGTHESVYSYDGESRRVRIKEPTVTEAGLVPSSVGAGALDRHPPLPRTMTASAAARAHEAPAVDCTTSRR